MIDLREDATVVRRVLEQRVSEFLSGSSDANKPLSAIEIGYCNVQAGWFFVNFDQRDKHDRDGNWTIRINDETEMPRWLEFTERSLESDSAQILTLLNGNQVEAWDSDDLAREIGTMLVSVVQQAGRDGVFKGLPVSETCQLDVEDFEGQWAWPEYEELGTVNLIRDWT